VVADLVYSHAVVDGRIQRLNRERILHARSSFIFVNTPQNPSSATFSAFAQPPMNGSPGVAGVPLVNFSVLGGYDGGNSITFAMTLISIQAASVPEPSAMVVSAILGIVAEVYRRCHKS